MVHRNARQPQGDGQGVHHPGLRQQRGGVGAKGQAAQDDAEQRHEHRAEQQQEGLQAVHGRHRRLSEATRAGVEALGLRPVADARWASWTVTAVWVPEGVDAEELVGRLRAEHGVVVAGGQGKLEGKVFRIGHLGYVYPGDVLRCLEALGAVLARLGVRVDPQAGVEAAARALEATAAKA